ncbi:MAG: ferritin-like domain-containing protein [Sandaracinaceae bacterium]|nr:ferritin-like domain-containing protein [Sandaracinaceae bacterium]
MRNQVEGYVDALSTLFEVRDPRVLSSIGPSAVRGTILKRGKQGVPTEIPARHRAYFDWTYPHDFPEMAELYDRAKRGQWNGDDLPWGTSVDPFDPQVPLVPDDFLDFEGLEGKLGRRFSLEERLELRHSVVSWMLSQFLHGEQGALFAAAQVTEAVQFFDGKLYGSTQVVDEGRHVEVFHRYLDTKLEKLYQINDNLFVIIDALMSDSRWDMKFLGMQIMVEGVALGAFGTLYRETKEPLLRALLRNVIQDEARHVHYGVLALKEHVTRELSESERREREDWAFEVALLMRNRFLAYEVYEEHFEGSMSRAAWREVVAHSPGMERFRHVMFSRMVPNLREIGLLSDRIRPHYARVGLEKYFGGLAAPELTGDRMLSDLDRAA